MKLKDFLQSQVNKAGVQIGAELDNVPDFDIPDAITSGINTSLISIADAKNNHSEIKGHYQKQSLDTIDKILKSVQERYPELAEDQEWLGERSTFKRVEILDSKLAALYDKKNGATNKDKPEIQKQIDALHAQLKAANDARKADQDAHADQMTQFKTKTMISQLMSGQKTIHDGLPVSTRNAILETLITQELQDRGVNFAFDDSGVLKLLKKDGSTFHGDDHQQVTPQQFIEQTLAKHKQLVTSNGQSNAANNGQPTRPVETANPKNASLIAHNEQVMANLAKASASPIMG